MEVEHIEGAGTETLQIPNFVKASIEKSSADKAALEAEKAKSESEKTGAEGSEEKTKEEGGKEKTAQGQKGQPDPTKNLLNNFFGKEGSKTEGGEEKEGAEKEGKEGAGNEETSFIEDLANEYGLDAEEYKEVFKDFDFKDDSYANLKKFNEIRDQFVANSAIDEVIKTFPQVGSLLEHLSEGKTLETWNQKIQAKDYSKIVIDKDNVEQQKGIIKELLTKQGVKTKIIEATLASMKPEEILAESEDSLKILDASEKNRLKQIDAEEQKRLAAEEKEATESMKAAAAIIKGGKINGVVIPDLEKKEFAQFAFSDKERNEKFSSLTLEQQLLIDYMVFKGFKLKGLDVKESPAEKHKTIKKEVGERKTLETTTGADGKENTIGLKELKQKMNKNAVDNLSF